MISKIIVVLCLPLLLCGDNKGFAQEQEAEQLLLNVVKLAELKSILDDLKKGYQIITEGYGAVQNISKGNFQLHKEFLDKLLTVSPVVAKYKRVADIIQYQAHIIKESKQARNLFSQDETFSIVELRYLMKVYDGLLTKSLRNLDELIMVTTASKLRMTDKERLAAIDRIYDHMQDQLSFLKEFNSGATALALKRHSEMQNINKLRQLYQLK